MTKKDQVTTPGGAAEPASVKPRAAETADTADQAEPTATLADTLRVPISVDPRRVPVSLGFAPREPSNAAAKQLWDSIRLHTEQIAFPEFRDFVDRVLWPDRRTADEQRALEQLDRAGRLNADAYHRRDCIPTLGEGGFVPGSDLYAVLKLAAEVFLLLRCGVCSPVLGPGRDEPIRRSPSIFDNGGDVDRRAVANALTRFLGEDRRSYVRSIIRNVFNDNGFQASPFSPISVGFGPCLLELIWSYWHEEGMLVQTTTAMALRFQNVSAGNRRDPLAELEIDPLRPLSGFLWGYIQDEPNRLSVPRRAHEYRHQYGLSLYGKAVPRARVADSRSKFLQAFHDLLRLADLFFREATDNTVTPDPFPLLVGLRDLHLLLAEGAHNQFRDLPWTARAEMLVEQWMLARTEARDFLRGRLMVPYPEPWMGAVDAMKRLQGWTDTNIIHFHDLARFGERLLLSVRHVGWSEIDDPMVAQDWALSWKPEIQGYIHGYRMATGVNLSDDVVEVSRTGDARYLEPAAHLRNRLAEQRQRRRLPEGYVEPAIRRRLLRGARLRDR